VAANPRDAGGLQAMERLHASQETSPNPLDLLEELVSANDWNFQRSSDSELMVQVEGRWCGYYLLFKWREDLGAICFSCHFDSKIPAHSRGLVYELLGRVNETLWLGHFDLTSDDGTAMFRHTVLLRGLRGASVEQLEDLVDAAVSECERFYPALQMVVWGGRPVDEALAAALMETLGEA
jgi:hypothetical protein